MDDIPTVFYKKACHTPMFLDDVPNVQFKE